MTPEATPGIHGGHEEPGVPARARVGERQEALGVVGGGTEEAGIVGITADDSVEGHDIRRTNGWSDHSEVSVGEGHSVGMSEPSCLSHCDVEVRSRRVDLGGTTETVPEQDVMNGADTSADVEKGRIGWERGVLHRSEELSGGRIGAPPMQALQIVLGNPAVELLIGGTAMAGGHKEFTVDSLRCG